MSADPVAQAKARAAQAAVDEVADGMIVGLGTGSTAALAIAALGLRVAAGLRITAVATSHASERLAVAAGIPLLRFEEMSAVDIAIDGADEVDPALRAIKGAGGALLREKVVAQAAARMICIVDDSKLVQQLGAGPLPVEVLPFARGFVMAAIHAMGGDPVLRLSAGRPSVTDQGNHLLDCHFAAMDDPEGLARGLDSIPGILGHGLFLSEIDLLLIGNALDVARKDRRAFH